MPIWPNDGHTKCAKLIEIIAFLCWKILSPWTRWAIGISSSVTMYWEWWSIDLMSLLEALGVDRIRWVWARRASVTCQVSLYWVPVYFPHDPLQSQWISIDTLN